MRWFSQWPEAQARWVRWILWLAWALLIVSLLWPALSLPAQWAPKCLPGAVSCVLHRQPGNLLFWGVVVPMALLILVVGSHELWRRICPLAFVSQLAAALGLQRKVKNKRGQWEPVKVNADSWLGRHHFQLQWSLLIAGLCLRLLLVNANPLGLAVLLICTMVAAALIGWAYAGKAWCQYVCPMAPVETIVTGQRGALGGAAHVGNTSKITQSMCRTISESGKEQSACVACQSPCIDIDSERHYWQGLKGKRGLAWAWYSYPGLVLMFFELMIAIEDHLVPPGAGISPLKGGRWAFDASLGSRAWDPLYAWLGLPRLVAIPVLLAAAGAVSVLLFQGIERGLRQRYERLGLAEAHELAVHRTRLLSSFLAVNLFFKFVDPTQGAFGPHSVEWVHSLVLTVSALVLVRSWNRDQGTYRRESLADRLRRQLQGLPQLDIALDGRKLEDLPPQEVFTLAKALPAALQGRARDIYQGVIRDLLRTGSLDRASALVDLEELRQSLQLTDDDHHAVIRLVAEEEPALLKLDQRALQIQQLRQEAFAEVVGDWLETAGIQVLRLQELAAAQRKQLDALANQSGLEPDDVDAVLARFQPAGDLAAAKVQRLQDVFAREQAVYQVLDVQSERRPLLGPLAVVMQQRLHAIAELLPGESVEALLRRATGHQVGLPDALAALWNDPDPDTAGWALMAMRNFCPDMATACISQGRLGLGSSIFLESQIRGELHRDHDEFPYLANSRLFGDLSPSGLLWVAEQGWLKRWSAGEPVKSADRMYLVLQGDAVKRSPSGLPQRFASGSVIGAMDVIFGDTSSADITAGETGLYVFAFPAHAFDELLKRSSNFSYGLLREFAQRIRRMGNGLPEGLG